MLRWVCHLLIAVWLLDASWAFAQTAAPKTLPPPEAMMPVPPVTSAPPAPVATEPALASMPTTAAGDRFWVHADYLSYAIPRTTLNFPIVTTGSPVAGCIAGAIDAPGTQVLFGNTNLEHKNVPGIRLMVGGWLDAPANLGLEASGFWIVRQSSTFQAASGANGSPGVYLSGYNALHGHEDSLIIAEAASQFSGQVAVTNDLQLWGTELNGLFALRRTPTFEWTLLTGMRFMELKETFGIDGSTQDLILNQSFAVRDRFVTTNQFFGPQLGSRFRWTLNRAFLETTAKIALGANRNTVDISGSNVAAGPDAIYPGTTSGGFYAQPSNIGSVSRTTFAALPTVELKAGYRFTPHFVGYFGYDLIFLNQIVRASTVVDRNLNLSQNAVYGTGTLTGPASPTPQITRTDFFVHGLNFGLELRY